MRNIQLIAPMKTLRQLSLILIIAPASVLAQQADFIIDNVWAGMPADKAKAAGYSKCAQVTYSDEIVCEKPQAPKEFAGIPIVRAAAKFEPPYQIAKSIEFTFREERGGKECAKTKGPWGDVKGPECYFDIAAELSKVFGPPISKGSITHWHKCGPYSALLIGTDKRLSLSYDSSLTDLHKHECAKQRKEAAERAATANSANSFIQKMK